MKKLSFCLACQAYINPACVRNTVLCHEFVKKHGREESCSFLCKEAHCECVSSIALGIKTRRSVQRPSFRHGEERIVNVDLYRERQWELKWRKTTTSFASFVRPIDFLP